MKTYALLTLTVSTLLAFIGSYFLDLTSTNSEKYLAVCVVIFADGFFGILAGMKREGFMTNKAIKIVKTFFFWMIVLSLVLTVQKSFDIGTWLSQTIIAPFLVFQIISILKNASMSGSLNNKILDQILDKIDLHKGSSKNN